MATTKTVDVLKLREKNLVDEEGKFMEIAEVRVLDGDTELVEVYKTSYKYGEERDILVVPKSIPVVVLYRKLAYYPKIDWKDGKLVDRSEMKDILYVYDREGKWKAIEIF